MATTYWRARPDKPTHCATCGAHKKLHSQLTHACPTEYRPDSVDAAVRDLADALRANDEARAFTARGNLQQLVGRHEPAVDLDHAWAARCAICHVPLTTATVRDNPAVMTQRWQHDETLLAVRS